MTTPFVMVVTTFVMVVTTLSPVPYGLVGGFTLTVRDPRIWGSLKIRWNHAYLVQNCAKNAIQTRKFWEMPRTVFFF